MGINNAINANETTPLTTDIGGTGTSSPPANTLPLSGGAANPFNFLGPLNDGQLLVGRTGNSPVTASLTAGTNISITQGAGSITINNSMQPTLPTNVVTTATQALSVNNVYIANRAGGNVTFTLPVTSVVGNVIKIIGRLNGWSIVQNASQQIVFGSKSTTIGTGGSLVSKHANDCIQLTCTVANTEWETDVGPQGNITVN